MDGSEWSALAAASTQALSSSVNAYMAAEANDDDREFAEKMYRWQRADALEDWNRINEYNLPSNVMQRLAQAGLNPNLAISRGFDGGSASSVRSSSVPGYSSRTPLFNMDFAAIANLASQIEVNKSVAKKNIAEAENAESKTIGQTYENERLIAQSKYFEDMAAFDWHLKDWATDIAEKEGKIRQLEYNLRLIKYAAESGQDVNIGDFENFIVASETPAFKAFKADLESKNLTNDEISARIKSLEKGVALTASEILLNVKRGALTDQETERTRLENNLRKNGLNPNDPVWMRMGVQMLAEYLGIDLNEVINKYKNQ